MWQHEDMATISAQQYYVDYGLDLTVERLGSLLPSYLPDAYIETQKDISYWIQVWHTRCNARVVTICWPWKQWLHVESQGWTKYCQCLCLLCLAVFILLWSMNIMLQSTGHGLSTRVHWQNIEESLQSLHDVEDNAHNQQETSDDSVALMMWNRLIELKCASMQDSNVFMLLIFF